MRSQQSSSSPPDALTGVVDALITRVLANPRLLAVILDEIRTIVREEIARAPFADRLLDVAEAAERIGMSEGALRKAVARGTVSCHRLGRRVRFRLSELMVEADARRERRGSRSARLT
jgi:excisionase family DNA binding protein